MNHFADRLSAAIRARRTCAVVGIDPIYERLPAELRVERPTLTQAVAATETFGRAVIDAVAGVVPAVKINIAFFEALYDAGVAAYHRLVAHAHRAGLLVIGDIKRGDIGSTAQLYARGHVERPAFADVDPTGIPDAVTVSGYLGVGSVQPFIAAARAHGRGLFVLVRPSDPGADVVHEFGRDGRRFYEHLAALVSEWGAARELIGECGLSCVGAVVAPKDSESTAALRAQMPHTLFLVPGYGAQGADATGCRPCFLPDGSGAIVNASRSVIFAFDSPGLRQRFGADWRACIASAARAFAADVARFGAG
ncbi:MAG: orotidine-5'-phosphate decarboxylase [Phycisphaerae bacterium]